MATVSSPKKLPRSIRRKLLGMRGKLTRWLLVDGLSKWILVALGVLAADMLLDRLFKMDFAQRMVMLVAMAIGFVVYFGWKVIKPLLLRPNDQALIYEVESKNPELKESLISGYQLIGQQDMETMGYSKELAEATVQQGMAKAEQIDFGKALDGSREAQNWLLLLAGVVLSGLLTVGVMNTKFLKTWFNRNIMLMDDQWPQSTYLQIVGAEDGTLVLPRGNDHRQLVVVTEDSKVTDVGVSIEIENPGGRTVHQMKPTGKLNGREHMFMFHNVSSQFRFRASGGDDVTDWIEVSLVEPPNIIGLKLFSLLPDYTGIDSIELAGGGPHSVLSGSKLRVEIQTNKPLAEAILKNGDTSTEMTQQDDQSFSIVVPGDGEKLAGGEYEFDLTDSTGLKSSRRSKFKVTLKEDESPKVRASLLGISGLVSSRARLPVSYQVADDYGLIQLRHEMNWKAPSESEKPVEQQLIFKEFETAGKPIRTDQGDAVLDILPFKLPPDTSFRFLIAAADNMPGSGGVGRSQEFLLRVVSDEELRGDLLRREIEQRKAFDQAYQAQMDLATNLQGLAARLKDADVSQEDFDARREVEFINQVRAQKGIGTAIDRVANRFEEFLVEVINNRLHEAENELAPEQRIETRFDERIIRPIRQLDQELISIATRHMDNCRLSVRDPEKLAAAVETTAQVHQEILEQMKTILNAMADSEGFQELVNDVLQITDESKKIQAEIENKMQPKGIFEEEKLDGIFDDN